MRRNRFQIHTIFGFSRSYPVRLERIRTIKLMTSRRQSQSGYEFAQVKSGGMVSGATEK
jgi:hypothetical protein